MSGACAGRVIPSRAAALPLATPGLADGQGCSAALRWHREGEEESMATPKFIDIDGRRFVWREPLRLRSEQLAAASKIEQPALFELKADCRPTSQRTAAGRYSEPSLFAVLEEGG
jgi:hypothetical protein